MSYTSAQYRYLIMRRLQRTVTAQNAARRLYYIRFFGELLDESVEINEEQYQAFCKDFDLALEKCNEKGIYLAESMCGDFYEQNNYIVVNALTNIGIQIVFGATTSDGYPENITFTKPNGVSLLFTTNRNLDDFYVNARSGMEYSYARAAVPHWRMENEPVIGMEDMETYFCGKGTTWRYDSAMNAVSIGGDGSFSLAPTTEAQLGSGAYSTVIIGANVSAVTASILNQTNVNKVVFLTPEDQSIKITVSNSTSTTKKDMDVYTDNEEIKSTGFGTRFNVTWHTLAEWEAENS